MTDLEFIYQMCKAAHYKGWTKKGIADCTSRIQNLSHKEFYKLRSSRWINRQSQIYPKLFSLLFRKQLDAVDQTLLAMTTEDLIITLKDCKSAYKKDKIPQILLDHYDTKTEDEKKQAFTILLLHNAHQSTRSLNRVKSHRQRKKIFVETKKKM